MGLRLVLGRMWGREGVDYRSWAVLAEARPLERQFWHARGIDPVEMPLERYVDGLARYAGLTEEAAV